MCRVGIYRSGIYFKPKLHLKYLIGSVICVGVVFVVFVGYVWFTCNRISLINHLKNIRNNDKLYKRVKAA